MVTTSSSNLVERTATVATIHMEALLTKVGTTIDRAVEEDSTNTNQRDKLKSKLGQSLLQAQALSTR